nr:hypothetical protein [Tanacetum cinerariifolium]
MKSQEQDESNATFPLKFHIGKRLLFAREKASRNTRLKNMKDQLAEQENMAQERVRVAKSCNRLLRRVKGQRSSVLMSHTQIGSRQNKRPGA